MKFENATFSAIPTATDVRSDAPVHLRLTGEELELLKAALANEYARTMERLDGMHYAGSSPTAMGLCRRRAEIETLMDRVTAAPPLFAVEPRTAPVRRELARATVAGRAA